jgi:hypothetical protein
VPEEQVRHSQSEGRRTLPASEPVCSNIRRPSGSSSALQVVSVCTSAAPDGAADYDASELLTLLNLLLMPVASACMPTIAASAISAASNAYSMRS